jgi:hypothetical protein
VKRHGVDPWERNEDPWSSGLQLCKLFRVEPQFPAPEEILGCALSTFAPGTFPLNGLRHLPHQSSGWYLWAGEEFVEEDDFFDPTHIEHLPDLAKPVLPYLALPPGHRFLIAPGHEDVWFDAALLIE